MIEPSPAPKRPRRRIWLWVLGILVLTVSLMVGLAAWLVPPWLESLATETLTTRLEKRLETDVSVGEVELQLPRVRISDVVIGDPETPTIRVDTIVVNLDEDALWSGRAEPVDVRVRGGAVEGDRETLETLVQRLRKPRKEPPPEKKGRISLVPERVSVRDFDVDVWEGARDDPSRHVQGTVRMNIGVAQGDVAVTLDELELGGSAVPEVRARSVQSNLQLVRVEGRRTLGFPVSVSIDGMGTQVTPQIAVAGVEGEITLSDQELTEIAVSLEGGLSDRDDGRAAERLWTLAGRVRRDLGEGELEVSMEAFELGKVPEVLARLPLVESEEATVGGRVAVVFGAGLWKAEGEVRLDGLNVAHSLLAREVVRDIGFDLDFGVEVDPAKPRVAIHHADFRRRGVELKVEGELTVPPEKSDRRYRLHAQVPKTSCDDVLQAIPSALVPSLQGFELEGTFDLDIDVDVDFADLDALILDGGVALRDCEVKKRPPRAAAERLAGGFTHRVTMRDGRLRSVHLYPGSSSFTPLPAISPYMVQAVLTTEDGGFWRHRGFLPSQFRTALHRNLQAGKIRLGASTITMQMVKNVLLSHERTLARKLQEMILTWYVESVLTKARIMEIYLNIVELGPGIYGVTHAADHYFGKHPADLTPPEAVYLALMLPSPVRRHANYCRSEPSERMMVKVGRILRIMNERNRLSDVDYEVWKDSPIEFDLRERGDSGACLGEIEALMAARQGQRALTGLLADPLDVASSFGGGGPPGPLTITEELEDPANADAPGVPAMDLD